jgi:prephenate dehydratase
VPPARKKPSLNRIAFQGELGAFSHAAALKLLGPQARPVPKPSFKEVCEALASGEVTLALLPIENTLHGSVHENYDHLVDFDFHVIGETSLRISHQLIVMAGTRMRDVRKVFSHPVALNQCRFFFRENPLFEAVPFYDTAGSVKMLSEENPPASAAIASEKAAEIYGGTILRRGIEDDRRNYTRFFLLTKQNTAAPRAHEPWKTSLVFSLANRPGSLFRAMACFALRDLNLTKIESRPLRGKPWEYLFYVDLLGSVADQPVSYALANLSELTDFLKVLGSYQPTP